MAKKASEHWSTQEASFWKGYPWPAYATDKATSEDEEWESGEFFSPEYKERSMLFLRVLDTWVSDCKQAERKVEATLAALPLNDANINDAFDDLSTVYNKIRKERSDFLRDVLRMRILRDRHGRRLFWPMYDHSMSIAQLFFELVTTRELEAYRRRLSEKKLEEKLKSMEIDSAELKEEQTVLKAKVHKLEITEAKLQLRQLVCDIEEVFFRLCFPVTDSTDDTDEPKPTIRKSRFKWTFKHVVYELYAARHTKKRIIEDDSNFKDLRRAYPEELNAIIRVGLPLIDNDIEAASKFLYRLSEVKDIGNNVAHDSEYCLTDVQTTLSLLEEVAEQLNKVGDDNGFEKKKNKRVQDQEKAKRIRELIEAGKLACDFAIQLNIL